MSMNYYDEIKNSIIEVLEEDKEAKDILYSSDKDKDTIIEELGDYFWDCDYITGNASGSYYMNSYKARKHCYQWANDVKEALEMYGNTRELESFEIFESLADDNYIDVDTIEINDDVFYEEEETLRWYIVNDFEEIKDLDFEKLDVITRCYMLYGVVSKVVEAFLKYGTL